MYLLLFLCSSSFASSSPATQPRNLHGVDVKLDTRALLRESPDWDPNAIPDCTLNTEWSPDPSNHAPILLDPISPFNDNGRIDNFLPAPCLMDYPALALNCNRCPRDLRCLQTLTMTMTPPPIVQSTSHPANLGGSNAVPNTVNQQPPGCPLRKYSQVDAPPCGSGVICEKDYRACSPERKGQRFGLKRWMVSRGWTWPGALNAFAKPGVHCKTPCHTLCCRKVRKGSGCDGLQSLRPGSLGYTVLKAIAAQEHNSSTVPSIQSLVDETLISTLETRIATPISASIGQTISTAGGIPVRSHVSHVSHVGLTLHHSTGRRPTGTMPTWSAANDDVSVPIIPGGMGAIQKPGVPPLRS